MPSISNNSAFFIFLLASAIALMLIVFLQPAENDASESESDATKLMPMPPIDGPNPKDAKRCNGSGEENTREYSHMFIFGRKDGGKSQAAKAVLLKGADRYITELFKDHIEMPIPACPSPAFMNGVEHILIEYVWAKNGKKKFWVPTSYRKHIFVDQQVLDLVEKISTQITGTDVELHIEFHVVEDHWTMDKQKRAAVAELVQTFLASARIQFYSSLFNTLFLPPTMDYGMEAIHLSIDTKYEIQLLLKFLSTDRRDGRQHVVSLDIYKQEMISDILDAIKTKFHSATTKLPQPFYIRFHPVDWAIIIPTQQAQEHNHETEETLSMTTQEPSAWHSSNFDIFRHPAGEQKVWAEDGKKRLEPHSERRKIDVELTILEFGMPFTTEKENQENHSLRRKRPYDFKIY